jgi:hypothetical protein
LVLQQETIGFPSNFHLASINHQTSTPMCLSPFEHPVERAEEKHFKILIEK